MREQLGTGSSLFQPKALLSIAHGIYRSTLLHFILRIHPERHLRCMWIAAQHVLFWLWNRIIAQALYFPCELITVIAIWTFNSTGSYFTVCACVCDVYASVSSCLTCRAMKNIDPGKYNDTVMSPWLKFSHHANKILEAFLFISVDNSFFLLNSFVENASQKYGGKENCF